MFYSIKIYILVSQIKMIFILFSWGFIQLKNHFISSLRSVRIQRHQISCNTIQYWSLIVVQVFRRASMSWTMIMMSWIHGSEVDEESEGQDEEAEQEGEGLFCKVANLTSEVSRWPVDLYFGQLEEALLTMMEQGADLWKHLLSSYWTYQF